MQRAHWNGCDGDDRRSNQRTGANTTAVASSWTARSTTGRNGSSCHDDRRDSLRASRLRRGTAACAWASWTVAGRCQDCHRGQRTTPIAARASASARTASTRWDRHERYSYQRVVSILSICAGSTASWPSFLAWRRSKYSDC